MKNSSFGNLHPSVCFSFFSSVIVFSFVFMHPVCLAIMLVSSIGWSIKLGGVKMVKFSLFGMIPLLLFMAVLNPLFNHDGLTILFYLKNGNPITMESIYYGIFAAMMFVSVIFWFICYNYVMTSEKFICLFGRSIPSMSLVFSMVLRFVPRFKEQFKIINDSQKCIGKSMSDGKLADRIKHGVKILSMLITWALENSIDTADSMKARGYGIKNRTSYSLFKFTKRDMSMILTIAFFDILIITFGIIGLFRADYFPGIYASTFSYAFIPYIMIAVLPFIYDVAEDIRWAYLKSKI